MKIKNLRAYKIDDSRKNPTVEVKLETAKGVFSASCPLGASTGKNEAVALEALKAIENVNNIIAPKIKGKDYLQQKELDELMIRLDGTKDKSFLGANAILPVSIAICRAGAFGEKLPLYKHIAKLSGNDRLNIPLPSFNFIEGGIHTKNQQNTNTQEFMVVPQKKSFKENLMIGNKVFNNLKEILTKSYGSKLSMGFEGGFSSPTEKTEQALFLLRTAIGSLKASIALDFAASEFYKGGKYLFDGQELLRKEMLDFYKDLANRFPIISMEDPFAQDDWQGFKEILSDLKNVIIVGDDLTTTNIKRVKEAKTKNACNGIIIKPNQIGTVSETIEAFNLSKSYDWKTIVSHRSGETMDDFIADLSVGLGADFIKSGSPSQPERMVKYNRLLVIEDELSKK